MPVLSQDSDRPSKKRRFECSADGDTDPDCDAIDETSAKRPKRSIFPSIINTVFNKVRSLHKWVTSQKKPRFLNISWESNSAAEAIAHGGQYLDEASNDKFMPGNSVPHHNGNGKYPAGRTAASLQNSIDTSSASLPPICIPKHQLGQGLHINGETIRHNSMMSNHNKPPLNIKIVKQGRSSQDPKPYRSDQSIQGGIASQLPVPAFTQDGGKEMFASESLTGQRAVDELSASTNHSCETRNGALQKKYIDGASKPTVADHSVYDKTFNEKMDGPVVRNKTRVKSAIEKCFDLEEKENYKRLLQRFNRANPQSFAHMSTRPSMSTVLERPLQRYLFTDKSVLPETLLETPVTTPSHSPSKSSHSSILESTPLPKSTVKSAPIEVLDDEDTDTNMYKPSAIKVKCDNLVKQIEEINARAMSRLAQQRRMVKEEEVTLSELERKREEEDKHLRRMVQQRLNLKPHVILDDLPAEEPEYDEFPVLGEEAESLVAQAFSARPNVILSEAFKLKLKADDMKTLMGLNWLNDEVVNFYFNLLQDRSGQEGLPSIYVFNTFFYPTLMKFGHSRLKRWTKQVDIFSKDFVLVPVHLGMHWCLASISFRDQTISYYDSMGGTNHACLDALRKYVQDESLDKKKQAYDMSGWHLECVKDIPQQMNGSDCGVFTCKYAEYISRDAPFSFTQEHMPYFRRRMVYEIITKRLL